MKSYELTAYELRDKIVSKEITALEVVNELFDHIKSNEPNIKAYLELNRELAAKRAQEIDDKIAKNDKLGKLVGVPIAVKDNLCTTDMKTTCASKILANFTPPYDAHVVERLREEDAIIIGKTNLDEFAMGSSTENSAFYTTRNPWDFERVPGGSSGGSAAAIAADMAHLALGSDTGGSVRQPAALCGVVGLKPTYGRVSRYGLIAFASSLDQIGSITKDVTDAALLSEVIAGYDKRDSTCANLAVPQYIAELERDMKGIRIGISKEYFGEGLDAEVEKAIINAIEVYRDMGAEIADISLPHSRIDIKDDQPSSYAVATYYIIAPSEASSNLARYDGVHYGHRTVEQGDIIEMYSNSRAEGFGDEVKRRIMLGTYTLSSGYYDAYYLKASKVRSLIKKDFDEAFEKVDCVICPTSPTAAFKIGEKGDPLQMYLSDIYTISANLAGIPGISIPCGFTKTGLPIGLQIMGNHFDELKLLQIARAFERETDYHLKKPSLS